MNADAFLAEASAIGDRLVRDAIWFRDRATWSYSRVEPNPNGGPQLKTLTPGIHSGTAGVGLFLARLGHATKDPGHLATARGSIAHALAHAGTVNESGLPGTSSPGGRNRSSFYLGGLGIGWAALEIARILQDSWVRRQGARTIREVIARPGVHEIDLMFGSASGICTALALEKRGVAGARDYAIQLGEDLLARGHHADGRWSWGEFPRNPAGRNLTGLSHGAAGYAYAFTRLFAETGNAVYRDAALGAFRYERDHFDAELDNWYDFLQVPSAAGRYPCRTTWCHGAPGAILARAACNGVLDDDEVAADIDRGLRSVRARVEALLDEPGEIFHLCCGFGGVVECLWTTEELLGIPGALARARDVGAWAVERYGKARWDADGWNDWPTGTVRYAHPYLMQGSAGIGLLLLRLYDPQVPSILLPALHDARLQGPASPASIPLTA